MTSRTKTYLAADWEHDEDAIIMLRAWNREPLNALSFSEAHDLTQARDSSLYCSIKSSLKRRMDVSNTFVLIVGEHTNNNKAGGCQFCGSYNARSRFCARGNSVDYRSFIHYECDMAIKADIRIIVLYKSCEVDIGKCPKELHGIGTHVPMYYMDSNNIYYWNYEAILEAFTA